MKSYQKKQLDKLTLLMIPIDSNIPLSTVFDEFNINNSLEAGTVIVDLLVYVGNSDKRFRVCEIINKEIYLNNSKIVSVNEDILDMSYKLFSEQPIGLISRIASPKIRKKILEKKVVN